MMKQIRSFVLPFVVVMVVPLCLIFDFRRGSLKSFDPLPILQSVTGSLLALSVSCFLLQQSPCSSDRGKARSRRGTRHLALLWQAPMLGGFSVSQPSSGSPCSTCFRSRILLKNQRGTHHLLASKVYSNQPANGDSRAQVPGKVYNNCLGASEPVHNER